MSDLPLVTSAFLNVTNACNCACTYCLAGDTKVLMNNYTQKDIKDIIVGDKIIGVDEFRFDGKLQRVRETTVRQVHKTEDTLIKISFDDGSYLDITPNHKILKFRKYLNDGWTEASKCMVGQDIVSLPIINFCPPDIEEHDYMIGYLTSMMMCDGSVKMYDYTGRYTKGGYTVYRSRLATKDTEIIDRVEGYLIALGLPYTKRPFLISTYQGDVYEDALFSSRGQTYEYLMDLFSKAEGPHSLNYYKGFLAAAYDGKGSISKQRRTIRISNSDNVVLRAVTDGLDLLQIPYVLEGPKIPRNKEVYTIRILSGPHQEYNHLRFILETSPSVYRKGISSFYGAAMLTKKKIVGIETLGESTVYNLGTDTRTYIANNTVVHNCFANHSPEYLDYSVAQDAADFLIKNAEAQGDIPSINFFGGEPMLCWDSIIVPLTKYVREKCGDRFNLSMTSNCTLINRERAKFMKDNGIGLLFSMDGGRGTQNLNRPMRNGRSSFDILENKIPIILEYFPDVMFRSTVTQQTCENLYENIMFAEQQGFINYFVMPNCFEEWHDIEPLQRNLRFYSDHYINSFKNGQQPIIFTQLEKYFQKILMRNSAIRENQYRGYKSCVACGKCGLGSGRYASININGDILACQELFSYEDSLFVIGNIYLGIDEAARQKLIDLYDASPAAGDNCSACPLNRICDGGCVANNYLISKDVHIVPKIYCDWSRLLFREACYIMSVLGADGNELFQRRWNSLVR